MNCPSCSGPLLFGATSCPCGYSKSNSPVEALSIELSYWESLRAFWRMYWPSQLTAIVLTYVCVSLLPLFAPAGFGMLAFQVVLGALTLYLFVPRICSRGYRGFELVVVETSTGETTRHLWGRAHLQAAVFLWWRQVVASLFAALLAMPLNILLGVLGLHVVQWVPVLAGVLVVGPILLKMLIGNEFGTFRIEARRQQQGAAANVAIDTPAAAS
jgi:hypothetical protein